MPQPTKNIFTDFLYPLLGSLLIAGGCFWAYRPLGLIVLGILLIVAAFMSKRSNR